MLILFLFFKHFFESRNSLFFQLYTHTSANKNRVFCFIIGDKKRRHKPSPFHPVPMHFQPGCFQSKTAKNQNNQKMKFANISHVLFFTKKRTFTPNNLLKRESWHGKKDCRNKNTGSFPTKSESFTLNVGKFLTFQNTQTRRFRRLPHEVRMEHLGSCYLEPIDFWGIEEAA